MPRTRLPISSVDHAMAAIEVDWPRVESRYVPLPAPVRRQMHKITEEYSVGATYEAAALPLKLARRRLDNLTRGAKNFWQAGLKELNGSSDDVLFVKFLLRKNFFDARVPVGVDALGFIRGLMTSMVVACDRAQKDLDVAGLDARDCWREWVVGLTAICEDNRLPTGARKISWKPSPFVALVQELQKSCPRQQRRFEGPRAADALAQAIQRARKLAPPRRSGKQPRR